MYKLLLVDDKVDSIEAISKLMDWKSLKIEKVIVATNGKEAIDKVFEDMPDIVITDIKMPVMDGLELAEEIKKINDEIITIILSGYDKFSFAQKALKLGVKEYLLKPVSIEDITKVIGNAVQILETRKDMKQEKGSLKTDMKKTERVLKEEYLNRLVKKSSAQISLLTEKYNDVSIDIGMENVISIIVWIDSYSEIMKNKTPNELDTMLLALQNIFTNAMSQYQCEIFRSNEKEICILLNNPQNKNIKLFLGEIGKKLKDIQRLINDTLNISVTIGIGKWVRSLEQIHTSYQNALEVIKYRIIRGKNNIINSYDMDTGYLDNEKNYFANVEKIISLFKRGQYDELMMELSEFWQKVKENNNISPIEFKSIMIQMLLFANTVLQDYNIENEEFRDRMQKAISLLDTYSTKNDVEGKIAECFQLGIDLICENKAYLGRLDVDRALSYIKENFKENISLKEVADYSNLSPSYLSMLIKEYTGENFKDILIKYRMERAKQLLMIKDYKIYEVASMVGYNDRRHFSDTFKKYTGLIPTEYKEKNL